MPPTWRTCLGALTVVLAAAAPLAPQSLPEARPGGTVTIHVPVSSGGSAGVNLTYRIELAPGVLEREGGAIEGMAGGHSRVDRSVRVTVPAARPPGPFRVAMLRRSWPGGGDSLAIHVMVVAAAQAGGGRGDPPAPGSAPGVAAPARVAAAAGPEGQDGASVAFGGLSREIEVELYGSTRAAVPGGVVVLKYTVSSYEDGDQRVRLRVEAPDDWVLLDPDVEDRELLVEGWEYVEGEVRLRVPRSAALGSRHRLRVVAHVSGEPGGAAVFWPLQVVRRGALRPGAVGLTGTALVSAANLRAAGAADARLGAVVALAGSLPRQTTLSFHYRQGPRESLLTNFRIPQEETRWSGGLRGRGWNLDFGNQVGSGGSAITGPYVRGRGASYRRAEGRVVGDLALVQPTSFVGDPGGRLVRGSIGLAGSWGRVMGAFSDFERPGGGYSTMPRYPEDLHPDSLERLERERKALAGASRNRVQGAGAELELRGGALHRLTARGGMLRLWNAAGDTIHDPGAEAYYTFSHRLAVVSAAWRRMPASLDGVHLPGDQASLDASVRVVGDLRATGRGYRSLQRTAGGDYRAESEGAALGFRYFRGRWRVDLRGNSREWGFGGAPTVARTGSLSFGVPLGPLALGGYLERGTQVRDTLRGALATYRGDARWQARGGMASLTASYYETLNGPPRIRADLLASTKRGAWELAGGAWATRGWVRGGEPGFWSQLGVPLTYDLLLSVGVEHAPTEWGHPPEWLGSVAIRKNVAVAIPFLRDPGQAVAATEP
jgi:hypothetical protein